MNILKTSKEDLRKYPHMSPVDVAVWKRFLQRYPDLFDKYAYDLRVGEGIPFASNVPDYVKRDWLLLTQKRIDAVGFSKNRIGIFEVKGTAGTTSPGQPLAYTILFKNKFNPTFDPEPILVCEAASPDVFAIANALHVHIYLV